VGQLVRTILVRGEERLDWTHPLPATPTLCRSALLNMLILQQHKVDRQTDRQTDRQSGVWIVVALSLVSPCSPLSLLSPLFSSPLRGEEMLQSMPDVNFLYYK
jgi:hypothetical protein